MPCITVNKGASGGSLLNGSYFVTMAYTINEQKVTDYCTPSNNACTFEGVQKVTDYCTPSNVQALFDHSNVAGSIDIKLSGLDETYDEFELVIVSVINQQTKAKKVGIFSTRQSAITIDI